MPARQWLDVQMEYFQKYEDRYWGLLKTKSNAERAVQKYLEAAGYPCYLPLLSNIVAHPKRKCRRMVPMFPGYIFAAWGTIEDKAKLHWHSQIAYYMFHDYMQEPFILESMELIKRIELASKEYEVNPCTKPDNDESVTLTSGVFSGCSGFLKKDKERSRLIIKLDLIGTYFEILMPNNVLSY